VTVAGRNQTLASARVNDRGCLLCDPDAASTALNRVVVWEDRLWRLAMPLRGYTTGFGYLEPKRHVRHITDLDGEEATTFGSTIARVASALKEAADAELVYVYIFGGGIPHLHVHLGPHRDGDPLNSNMIRGEIDYEPVPGGAQRIVSRDFDVLPAGEIERVIDRARAILARDDKEGS
jgi:diadenosine tetraphosphate (Ap4A) HIT family hydrolase